MLTAIIIGTIVVFALVGMIAVPLMAMRDARKGRTEPRFKPRDIASNQRPPEPPHPLAWLPFCILGMVFAGVGVWQLITPPSAFQSGAKWISVILAIASVTLGEYGPGMAWLAMGSCLLAMAVRKYRAVP